MHPEVLEAIMPYLSNTTANASSLHSPGRLARSAIELARQQVAELINCAPESVIFTSGGTEANNLVFKGYADSADSNPIISSEIEHPSVLQPLAQLQQSGYAVIRLKVNALGQVDLEAAQEILQQHKPQMFSVMLANNEVGTLQPVAEIAKLARQRGILSHSDCAQAVGKVPVGLEDLGVDMISVAGHKIYGPKGIGALITRPEVQLRKIMFGADHEGGRRPGTENVLGIVGMGKACSLIAEDLEAEIKHLQELRDLLAKLLLAAHPEAQINGHPSERLPNTLSVSWPGRVAGEILANLPDVAVSAGAACHSEGVHISHVLTAMGVPVHFALGTLRLSLGRMSKKEDVVTGAERVNRAVDLAPLHS